MSYMLLIVEPQGQRQSRGLDDGQAVYEHMLRYTAGLKARGVLLASNSLRENSQRLTVRGGKRTVLDGPFTESKELIGGFFLVNCETRDEALALAAECPAAEWATVEVREVGPCYT
ncbi:MAG: YciI family protein [Steroidobacteraceae bacterium]